MFDEQRYFSAGDRVGAFGTRFGRAGMLICEDMWHSSLPYILTLDGALLLLSISSSPARGIDGDHRSQNTRSVERLYRFYAKMHGLFVISVNRVGYEDGVAFWGGSEVIGPDGEVKAKSPYFEEDLSCLEIDLLDLRRERVFTPLMRDENIDLTIRELRRIRNENQGQ
jgi:predicted amidohydrolase